MPVPAQPAIDALEAAVTSLTTQLTQIKAEKASLDQQIEAGVITDAQAAKLKMITDTALGK